MNRRTFLTATAAGAVAAGCQDPPAPIPSTTDPLDRLTNRIRDLAEVPAAEFSARLDRLRDGLARNDATGYLAEAGSSLQYFSGIRWGRSERLFALVAGHRGNPILICPAFERDRAHQQNRLDLEIRTWHEDQDPAVLLVDALRELGAGSGKVLVEPTTRWWVHDSLRRTAPSLEIGDGREVTETCRMQKSPVEVERIRRACELTLEAFQAALAGIWEGMTETQLAQRVTDAFRRLGVRGGAMVLFGANSALPHGSDIDRHLRVGDVILMDGGCTVSGYQSDVTRTVVYGEPSGLQLDLWRLVWRAQRAAIDAVRPEVTCAELDQAARRVIHEGGYGPGYEYFSHRLGHGLGLDGHEPPYLVAGNLLQLRPGMVISVEPGIYLPNQFGIRHEDNLLVTEEGFELLHDPLDADAFRVG